MTNTSLPGHPRVRELLTDSLKGAVSQPVATCTAALILCIVCLAVFVTTGQAAVAENQVISRIDSTGTRLVSAFDSTDTAQIHSTGLFVVDALSTVSWSFGLGPAVDVRNAAYLTDERGTASRLFYGSLPPDLQLTTGRLPRSGEAIAGKDAATALHFADGAGTVVGDSQVHGVPVVGTFTATGPLAHLNNTVVIMAKPSPTSYLRFVYVLADDVSDVDSLGQTLADVLIAEHPENITVETPAGAIALRSVIAGDLGESGRRSMLLVLGVGLVIISVTMFGAVAARRREFGRRRALGASRSVIVVIVLVQALTAVLIGVMPGVVGGVLLTRHLAQASPPASFIMGVAGIVAIVAILGAAPPAVAAAFRDPLRILRVP